MARLLLFSVLVVATCGLVYELITATMASYLLGDSVTQFSLVIGVYLSAMGVGSWMSQSIEKNLVERFISIQLLIAWIGGFSAPLLFFAFSNLQSIQFLIYTILVVIGILVGLEIPILIRLMPKGEALKKLVARVLAFDYIGSLFASLLFPLLLLPHLGLVQTSLFVGTLNAAVALAICYLFRNRMVRPRIYVGQALVTLFCLALAFLSGQSIERFGERQLHDAPVILSERTTYQRLTVTQRRHDTRLYINGNLQFSSLDEHRYHESLVHPAVVSRQDQQPLQRVLILGGGDGLALREVLKYSSVTEVSLVDLDPKIIELFRDRPFLRDLNQRSLSDARVKIFNDDALLWLRENAKLSSNSFDLILIDLPDPNNYALGKLYSDTFYRQLHQHLAPGGAIAVQATSPQLSPTAFWCVIKTAQAANWDVLPFHVYVPSFGDWGFALLREPNKTNGFPKFLPSEAKTRFLNNETMAALFVFAKDQQSPEVEINRLNTQSLVRYYEQDMRNNGLL